MSDNRRGFIGSVLALIPLPFMIRPEKDSPGKWMARQVKEQDEPIRKSYLRGPSG